MPYGGHSAIGLITLLDEVAMPHITDAAYDLSTPAGSSIVTGVQTPTRYFACRYFFAFFALTKTWAKKVRKNITHLSKSLYHTISLANVRFVSTGHIGKDEPFLLTISFAKELN